MLKDVFDPTRTLHEENYCMVELVRQIGSVGRETRELQETVRYLEFVTDSLKVSLSSR